MAMMFEEQSVRWNSTPPPTSSSFPSTSDSVLSFQNPISPPPQANQRQFASGESRSKKEDICFKCKKEGHWVKDCPMKSPNPPTEDFPIVHCLCGAPCVVKVSRTAENPGRKFYTCPLPREKQCGFFKWCKGATGDVNIKTPICECSAGPCRIYTETNGPGVSRKFFVCPIKKEKQCGFFKWCKGATSDVNIKTPICECSAGPCRIYTETNGQGVSRKFFVCPIKKKWATRKRYSAGDKRSFQVSRESMNEKLDSRLQFIHMSQCAKADGSGPTVSNSEKGRLREALKCDSLTNTRSLNDLQEHFGARRKDAAKCLCDSLALKSFEVLDSLPLGEQSNSIRNLARRRTLTHKHCVRLKKLQDLQQSLLSDCSGELAAQAALGLSDGGHIPSLPEKKIVRKTLKRKSRTMSVLSLEDDQQHVGRRWEDDAKFLGAKRICRQLAIDRKPTKKRILRQHGTCRCQFKQSAIDLPDGGHILSLSKKKIVRKTLKRKCRNMSVLRSEYHQHVDSKWDDAVKSLGAKHIYRQLVIHRVSRAKRIREQHGFHRWPFQRNLATWKGYFLGGERPDDVISLSMDGILVSRLQLIHISWLGRFSPRSPALLPQGEIVEPPLALSSSQLPSTSIRAHLGGQYRSGSSTSHSQNERTRDQPEGRKRKIKNLTIEDLRPYVRLPRAQAARELQISESSFKRLCRRLKIEQWPKLPPGEEILKPPDPPGRNAGQIGMVNEFGHLPEPIEVSRPPDPCERNTGQTEEENDVVVNVHVQNHLQDNFDSPIGWFEGNDSTDLQYVLQGIEVDQVIDEPLLSSAYPNSPAETRFEGHGAVSSNQADVFLQPRVALTHMVSGNMGIPNNRRNLLASPAETRLEGHGAVSSNHCPNPNPNPNPDVFLQPQVSLTHMVSGNMGIPNNWRNSLASPAETRLEGHGAVSSNHCPNPNPDVFLQPQVALTHMASGHMGIPNNQRNSLSSPAETRLEGHGTVSSNQAMIQPMSTLPQMTPPSTSSEDTSSVMLKVYGLRKIIIFPFPLTSGINELKGEVAMRLDLQKDSFDMNYKDDEGENIFIPLDKDLRYYLTKRTSSVNSVIKLWVVNNDANPTNLCGSCGGSLMR